MNLKVVEKPPTDSAMTDEGPIMKIVLGHCYSSYRSMSTANTTYHLHCYSMREPQHFELLDLPAEFRAVIYEMVLAISKIFLTLGSGGGIAVLASRRGTSTMNLHSPFGSANFGTR